MEEIIYMVYGEKELEEVLEKEIALSKMSNSNTFKIEYNTKNSKYVNTIEVNFSNSVFEKKSDEKIKREIKSYILNKNNLKNI